MENIEPRPPRAVGASRSPSVCEDSRIPPRDSAVTLDLEDSTEYASGPDISVFEPQFSDACQSLSDLALVEESITSQGQHIGANLQQPEIYNARSLTELRTESGADLYSVNLSNASSMAAIDQEEQLPQSTITGPACSVACVADYFTNSDSTAEFILPPQAAVAGVSLTTTSQVPHSTTQHQSGGGVGPGSGPVRGGKSLVPTWKQMHLNAWIPSPNTKTTIEAFRSGLDTQKKCYIMPGVLLVDTGGDPVRDLTKKHLGDAEASKRQPFPVVEDSEYGLSQLIACGHYRAALTMTLRLLTLLGQGYGKANQPSQHSEFSLKLWSLRFQLLLRLRFYNAAAAEMDHFGALDIPDLYFEYHSTELEPGKTGSMVPFSMRLLHAVLPQYAEQPQVPQYSVSLQRLNYMERIIQQMIKNLSSGLTENGVSCSTVSFEQRQFALDLWNDRLNSVRFALANCLVKMKEYRLAFDVYEKLMAKITPEHSWEIICLLGRLHVQIGDYNGAVKWFQKFAEICELRPDDPALQVQALCNSGQLHLFQNNFSEALDAFHAALAIDPKNYSLINNCAVFLPYLGRLEEAITLLENALNTDPRAAVSEQLVLNLCTLYELASARSMERKHRVLNVVNQTQGDKFDVSCLKMTSPH